MCTICENATVNTPESRGLDGYKETCEAIVKYSEDLTSSERLAGQKLFYTNAKVFDVFINSIPEEARSHYNCKTCHHFFDKYGTLVFIDEEGDLKSILWNENIASGIFVDVIKKMRIEVETAGITKPFECCDFNSNDWSRDGYTMAILGIPKTGEWSHFYARINYQNISCSFDPGHTREWATHIFETASHTLNTLSVETITKAIAISSSDKLSNIKNPKKIFEAIKEIKEDINKSTVKGRKYHKLWKYAFDSDLLYHLSGSMEGKLLSDIDEGYSVDSIIERYNEMADPINYRRPKSGPTEGNIKEAEKLIADLGLEPSLKRKFATLEEIPNFIWKASEEENIEVEHEGGVFAKVLPKGKTRSEKVDLTSQSAIRMTFIKFVDKVLPEAKKIYFKISGYRTTYCAYTSALDPEAPPIMKWDNIKDRNTFSNYVYHEGSYPERWNLPDDSHVEVLAIIPSPEEMLTPEVTKSALLVLKDCKDTDAAGGSALFPNTLIPELYPIRKTIESFSTITPLHVPDGQLASGYMMFENGNGFDCVVETDVAKLRYTIDRWD